MSPRAKWGTAPISCRLDYLSSSPSDVQSKERLQIISVASQAFALCLKCWKNVLKRSNVFFDVPFSLDWSGKMRKATESKNTGPGEESWRENVSQWFFGGSARFAVTISVTPQRGFTVFWRDFAIYRITNMIAIYFISNNVCGSGRIVAIILPVIITMRYQRAMLLPLWSVPFSHLVLLLTLIVRFLYNYLATFSWWATGRSHAATVCPVKL